MPQVVKMQFRQTDPRPGTVPELAEVRPAQPPTLRADEDQALSVVVCAGSDFGGLGFGSDASWTGAGSGLPARTQSTPLTRWLRRGSG
jgi:hypothetical protein